jgi:hypothetical protein
MMKQRDPTVSNLWLAILLYLSPCFNLEPSWWFALSRVCKRELGPHRAFNCHITFAMHQRRHNFIWQFLLKNIIVA